MVFFMFRYSCNMTTAAITTTAVPTVTAPVPATTPTAIDFDTRLALAGIKMDVLLDVGEDTQAAVSEALKEADSLAVAGDLKLRETAAQKPQRFRSQPILKAAGDLIRARGWTTGQFQTGTALCALGAIRTATRGNDWSNQPEPAGEYGAINVLLERIADEFGPGLSVPGWNDRQTSDEGVLRLLW